MTSKESKGVEFLIGSIVDYLEVPESDSFDDGVIKCLGRRDNTIRFGFYEEDEEGEISNVPSIIWTVEVNAKSFNPGE